MIKGYALDSSRVLVSPENYLNLVNVVNDINSTQGKLVKRVEKLEEKYPEFENKLFFKGQMYDAFSCIANIIQTAKTEINDFNKQYCKLCIKYTTEFHDRFMILDQKVLYHIGASIKDAGKKAFEISQIDDEKQILEILKRLSHFS